jgi:hypothetical protein
MWFESGDTIQLPLDCKGNAANMKNKSQHVDNM